jgi:hypothetical protein
MSAFVLQALFGAVVLFIALSWYVTRSRGVLRKWARDNGVEIVASRFCFFNGPFIVTSTKGQAVYYVTVRDPSGGERSGWVRCGGFFVGMLSDSAVVKWDSK